MGLILLVPFLLVRFGQAYTQYMREVRRYF